MESKDRMRQLVEELNQHAYRYYVLDNPVISDKQYDVLFDELVQLEKELGYSLPDSPSAASRSRNLSSTGTSPGFGRWTRRSPPAQYAPGRTAWKSSRPVCPRNTLWSTSSMG